MKDDVELIIVDGGTGEEFFKAVGDLSCRHQVLSEPDQGIYDAMNKGLSLSSGDYVWFLNGGDLCAVTDLRGFIEALITSDGSLLLASYSLDTGFGKIRRRPRDASYIWHGLPTSHQAILYPGDAARTQRYDLSYRIVGDYDFTARLLVRGINTKKISHEISSFQLGGVSQQHAKLVASEATRVQRSVLNLTWYSLLHSRLRHTASRTLRHLQTRSWGREAI